MAESLGRAVLEIDVETGALRRGLSSGLRDVQAFEARGNAALSSFADAQRRNFHTVVRAASVASAALAGGLAVAITDTVKKGAEFEAQMDRVAAVAQANGREMNTLRRLALRLGADTKFSASEAAEAMYELSSAGFSVKEMAGAVPGTLALAAASSIDLAAAAEISGNALRGFGMDARESGKVADILAQAVNASSVEMDDLRLTMKYIGPVAKSTGQSFAEMIAAVSVMGDAGIKGEQAGTTLRAGLLRLVNPVGQVKDGLKTLGLEAKELQGPNGLLPLPQLIGKIREGTEGLTVAQRNQALAQIFGQEALSGMLTVVDAGPEKLARLTRGLEQSDGAAQKAAKTMQDNVAGAWEEFGGSIETVQLKLYEHFEKPLAESIREATRIVNKEGRELDRFFEDLLADPVFRRADIVEKVQIAIRELRRSKVGDELAKVFEDVDLSELFADAISAAIPAAAEAAADGGAEILQGVLRGFTQSNLVGRAAIAWMLIRRLGLTDVFFRQRGTEAGHAFADGVRASSASQAIAAATVPSVAAFRYAGRNFEQRASGVLVPVAEDVGRKSGQGLIGGLTGRLRGMAPRVRSIAKGVLGVNIAFGIAAGIASEAPTLEGKIQDTFASIDPFGFVESWDEKAEKAIAAWQRGLRRGMSRQGLADALGIDETQLEMFEEYGMIGGKALSRGLIPMLNDVRLRMGRAERATETWRAALERAREEGVITDDVFADLSDQIDATFRSFERGKGKLRDLRDDIHRLRVGFHGDLGAVNRDVERNMQAIERSFGRHSKVGKDLLASNYRAAEKAIRRAMKQGEIDTEEGLEAIEDLIRKRLALYGIKGADAEKILKASKEGRNYKGGLWTGGLIPGYSREDDTLIAVRGGEAVLRPEDHVPTVDMALRATIGMGLREYLMATGAKVGGGAFARGGFPMVRGDTDFQPALGWALSKMARATSTPIFVQSGGRTMTEQTALYRRYLAGAGPVAAKPSPNAPHVSGRAADITPGRERFGGVAGRFGLGFTVPSESWHIELLNAVGGARGAGGRPFELDLPRFAAAAPAFAPAAVQLNRMAAALEREIARRVSPVGGGSGGAWEQRMREIAAQHGWNFADWWELVMRESGADPTAVNPNSGAFGLGQFLGATARAYAKYGALSHNPVKQIEAMAMYILDRYGDPTAALRFHDQHNWYRSGGAVSGPALSGKGRAPGMSLDQLWRRARRAAQRAAKLEERIELTERRVQAPWSPAGSELTPQERDELVRLHEGLLSTLLGQRSALRRIVRRLDDRDVMPMARKRIEEITDILTDEMGDLAVGRKAREALRRKLRKPEKVERELERRQREREKLVEERDRLRDRLRDRRADMREQLREARSRLRDLEGVTGKGGQISDVRYALRELQHQQTAGGLPAPMTLAQFQELAEAIRYGAFDTNLPQFHRGGWIVPPGGASEMAIVAKRGEYVMDPDEVDRVRTVLGADGGVYEIEITNWDQGKGLMRRISRSAVAEREDAVELAARAGAAAR